MASRTTFPPKGARDPRPAEQRAQGGEKSKDKDGDGHDVTFFLDNWRCLLQQELRLHETRLLTKLGIETGPADPADPFGPELAQSLKHPEDPPDLLGLKPKSAPDGYKVALRSMRSDRPWLSAYQRHKRAKAATSSQDHVLEDWSANEFVQERHTTHDFTLERATTEMSSAAVLRAAMNEGRDSNRKIKDIKSLEELHCDLLLEDSINTPRPSFQKVRDTRACAEEVASSSSSQHPSYRVDNSRFDAGRSVPKTVERTEKVSAVVRRNLRPMAKLTKGAASGASTPPAVSPAGFSSACFGGGGWTPEQGHSFHSIVAVGGGAGEDIRFPTIGDLPDANCGSGCFQLSASADGVPNEGSYLHIDVDEGGAHDDTVRFPTLCDLPDASANGSFQRPPGSKNSSRKEGRSNPTSERGDVGTVIGKPVGDEGPPVSPSGEALVPGELKFDLTASDGHEENDRHQYPPGKAITRTLSTEIADHNSDGAQDNAPECPSASSSEGKDNYFDLGLPLHLPVKQETTSFSTDKEQGSRNFLCRKNSKLGARASKDPPPSEGSFFRNSLRAATRSLLVSKTVDEVQLLRLAREEELTAVLATETEQSVTSNEEYSSSQIGAAENESLTREQSKKLEAYAGGPVFCKVFGILYQKHRAKYIYRYAVLGFCLVLVGFHVERALFELRIRRNDFRIHVLGDAILAIGCFVGLLALRYLCDSDILGSAESMLVTYARRQEVVDRWSMVSFRHTVLVLVLWVSSVISRGLSMVWDGNILEHSWREWLAVGAHTCSSAIFVGLVFGVMHVVSSLVLLVDAYCYYAVLEKEVERNVSEWNMLQAVMRKSSVAVETAFLVLQTTALMYVLLTMTSLLVNGLSIFSVLAVILLVIADARLFYKAAQVTEKCARVPPLINSLSFGNSELDPRRHYLVEYMHYSAAGFYVCEVRITTIMAIKLSYVSGILAFGIVTKMTTGY